MPNRFVSVAILGVWAYATFALLQRDVLPGLLIGPPPDLLAVTRANDNTRPSRWSILVVDDDMNMRSVGQVETLSRRSRDGWVRLQSRAWFDSEELLEGTPFGASLGKHVEVDAVFDVDFRGNLESLRASISSEDLGDEALVLSGTVRNNQLQIQSSGLLEWERAFPYEPREMVQSPLAPVDRLPGLQVGQRWTSRIVSPITGQVSRVEATVDRREVITWDGNPVSTYVVVTRFSLLSARTWVRAVDGLVLRQEVPLPLVQILLERLPERYIGPDATFEDHAR